MSGFIDYAFDHARLTIATLIFLLCAGLVAYVTIAKEAEPDVKIPMIYVQLSQRGISPEDSERLLLRASRDATQVGRQREGDALDGIRRRRFRSARVRSRL
jgi:hypothetical protein